MGLTTHIILLYKREWHIKTEMFNYTIVSLFIFHCRHRSLGHTKVYPLFLLCGTG